MIAAYVDCWQGGEVAGLVSALRRGTGGMRIIPQPLQEPVPELAYPPQGWARVLMPDVQRAGPGGASGQLAGFHEAAVPDSLGLQGLRNDSRWQRLLELVGAEPSPTPFPHPLEAFAQVLLTASGVAAGQYATGPAVEMFPPEKLPAVARSCLGLRWSGILAPGQVAAMEVAQRLFDEGARIVASDAPPEERARAYAALWVRLLEEFRASTQGVWYLQLDGALDDARWQHVERWVRQTFPRAPIARGKGQPNWEERLEPGVRRLGKLAPHATLWDNWATWYRVRLLGERPASVAEWRSQSLDPSQKHRTVRWVLREFDRRLEAARGPKEATPAG